MADKKTDQKVAKPAEGETHTELADVPNPAKVTEAQIKDITADDGTDDRENSANADAADTLRQNKKDAKANDANGTDKTPYFNAQGGAADL